MGSLYNKYKERASDDNLKSNALLIYNLAAEECPEFYYSINEGDDTNHIRLYAKIVPNNHREALLQATQNKDGSIQLSIQGLHLIYPEIENNIDYFNPNDYPKFMQYLELF